jgi:hypothetical protein
MTTKIAIFALSGDAACFGHALIKTLELYEKRYEVKMVIDGPATALVRDLTDQERPFSLTYSNVKKLGLIDCVCKVCSVQFGSIKSVEEQGLPLYDNEMEHPSKSKYTDVGYEVIESLKHTCVMCHTWDKFEPDSIKSTKLFWIQ